MLPYHLHLRAAATRLTSSSLLSRIVLSQPGLLAQPAALPSHSSSITRPQNRGKKTKSSITLDPSPQIVTALHPLPSNDEEPEYPVVVAQALSHMRKFHNCVVLTRVGGFYELYFEQAEEFGPLLNIKVAQKKISGGRAVAMVRNLLCLSMNDTDS